MNQKKLRRQINALKRLKPNTKGSGTRGRLRAEPRSNMQETLNLIKAINRNGGSVQQ